MAQVEQFSSFPHAASRALSLLLENIDMVAKGNRRLWRLKCNVSMWHWLKRCLRSCHRLHRSSWQRDTDVSSSLHKLIGIVEVRLLSAAAGRVPWAFRWEACMSRPGGTGGARRESRNGPSGNCSDAVACRT